MKLLHHAAFLSNAHDFITEMSSQYDTQAGEKGLQLSGIIFSLWYLPTPKAVAGVGFLSAFVFLSAQYLK